MGKLDLVQSTHGYESAMSDLNMKFTLETMEELLLELIEDYSVAMDDEILNAMTRKLKLLSLINREALSTAKDGDVKAISFVVDPQDLQLINDLQDRVNDLQDRAKDLQDRFERDAEPEPNDYEFQRFEREAAPVGYGSGYVERESAPEKLTKRIHEAEDFDAEAEPERNGYEFDRFEGEAGSE